MKKNIAVITDVHGNFEALQSILTDIKNKNIDDIICLGDTIDIGPNSKECIDLLIENNVKMVLGNHELYLLRGTDIEQSITVEEKKHYEWVKRQLAEKEIKYIKNCPLSYEYTIKYNNKIPDYKLIFCHYLYDNDKLLMPFEKNKLNKDLNLWVKYNDDRKEYYIGHLHYSVNPNDVNGILGDIIEETGTLTNINVVESAGCTKDEYSSYVIINIDKSISSKTVRVKYDRKLFLDKVLNIDFPDKKNILKCFYGIEI